MCVVIFHGESCAMMAVITTITTTTTISQNIQKLLFELLEYLMTNGPPYKTCMNLYQLLLWMGGFT